MDASIHFYIVAFLTEEWESTIDVAGKKGHNKTEITFRDLTAGF